MRASTTRKAGHPVKLIEKKTGDWWKDHRRNWCAYCGIELTADQKAKTFRTQDHIMPKGHRPPGTRNITVPACRGCNEAKGKRSLQDFLHSSHFAKVRRTPRDHQWSLRDLWLVMALAAVHVASRYESLLPATPPETGS